MNMIHFPVTIEEVEVVLFLDQRYLLVVILLIVPQWELVDPLVAELQEMDQIQFLHLELQLL